MFTHPDYSHNFQHVYNLMDPPSVQDAISERTGIPLIQSLRANNGYVRDMVDMIHNRQNR